MAIQKASVTAVLSCRGYEKEFNVLDDLSVSIQDAKDNTVLGVVTAEKALERENVLVNNFIKARKATDTPQNKEMCNNILKKIKDIKQIEERLLDTPDCQVLVESIRYKHTKAHKCVQLADVPDFEVLEFTNPNVVSLVVDSRDKFKSNLLGEMCCRVACDTTDKGLGANLMDYGVVAMHHKGFFKDTFFEKEFDATILLNELLVEKLDGLSSEDKARTITYYSDSWFSSNLASGLKSFLCDMFGLGQVGVRDSHGKTRYYYLKHVNGLTSDKLPVYSFREHVTVKVTLKVEFVIDDVPVSNEIDLYYDVNMKDMTSC